MAHNTLIRNPATKWATDAAGISQVLQSELMTFDANLAAAINGDDGGCWIPGSFLNIGAQGLLLTGPLVVGYGGQVSTGTDPTITCADNDWPQLDPSNPYATHTVMHSCALAVSQTPWLFRVRPTDGGLQAIAPTYQIGAVVPGITSPLFPGIGSPAPARAYVQFRGHDNSTLTSVTVNFKVGAQHSQVPSTMPMVRVLRVGAFGDAFPMTSQSAGANKDGYVSVPKATSPVAWYNAGQAQSLTIPCDQNNQINVGFWDYRLELVDEQGATAASYPFLLNLSAPITTWQANTPYPAGTAVVATPPNGNGFVFVNATRKTAPDWTSSPYKIGQLILNAGPKTGLYYMCITVLPGPNTDLLSTYFTQPDPFFSPPRNVTGIDGWWQEYSATGTGSHRFNWRAWGPTTNGNEIVPMSGITEPAWNPAIGSVTGDGMAWDNTLGMVANNGTAPQVVQWTNFGPPTGTIWLNFVTTFSSVGDLRAQ